MAASQLAAIREEIQKRLSHNRKQLKSARWLETRERARGRVSAYESVLRMIPKQQEAR